LLIRSSRQYLCCKVLVLMKRISNDRQKPLVVVGGKQLHECVGDIYTEM